jgi:hypothetical protein
MVAATGVLVAAGYYIMNMRVNQKAIKTTQETRQAQLYVTIYQDLSSSETIDKFINIVSMQFKDYDEFERKYGSDNNREHFVKRYSYIQKLNSLGWLVKQGLIDETWIYEAYGWNIMWTWKKMESIMLEQVRRYGFVGYGSWLRYLNDEMKSISDSRGGEINVPETYTQYIPDK